MAAKPLRIIQKSGSLRNCDLGAIGNDLRVTLVAAITHYFRAAAKKYFLTQRVTCEELKILIS